MNTTPLSYFLMKKIVLMVGDERAWHYGSPFLLPLKFSCPGGIRRIFKVKMCQIFKQHITNNLINEKFYNITNDQEPDFPLSVDLP